MSKSLAEVAHWEGVAEQYTLPVTIRLHRYYAYRRIDVLLQKFLTKGGNCIELGCAPGGWLAYFVKRFRYRVSGIEYTAAGYAATKKNLHLLGIRADIRNEDLFRTTFNAQSFSTVFSFGLIEHFRNPAAVLRKHVQLLKRDGALVIVVPNLQSPIYALLQKLFGRYEQHIHVPYTLDKLRAVCASAGITTRITQYIGVCNFNLINPSRLPRALRSVYWACGIWCNWLLTLLLLGRETALFSPYLIFIGRRR